MSRTRRSRGQLKVGISSAPSCAARRPGRAGPDIDQAAAVSESGFHRLRGLLDREARGADRRDRAKLSVDHGLQRVGRLPRIDLGVARARAFRVHGWFPVRSSTRPIESRSQAFTRQFGHAIRRERLHDEGERAVPRRRRRRNRLPGPAVRCRRDAARRSARRAGQYPAGARAGLRVGARRHARLPRSRRSSRRTTCRGSPPAWRWRARPSRPSSPPRGSSARRSARPS